VEIKSVKVFKNNNIEDITSGTVVLPKETMKRQCFTIEDGKCVLRENHAYYYQVQMQLLVTERDFCDFILYAEEGEVSIERIFRNESLINEIQNSLTALWFRVLAPEIFEMRVPRGLNPFILPNIELNIREYGTEDFPGKQDEEVPGREDEDVPEAERVEVDGDCNPQYAEDLGADFLADAESPVNLPCLSMTDLIVVPWGGETTTGIRLVNTCPIDNWLMIFQALERSKKIDLSELTETGATIASALQLIDDKQFGDALLTQPQVINNTINLYGSGDDYFIQLLKPYLYSKVTSVCRLSTCPKPLEIVNSCCVSMGIPANQGNNVFTSALNVWTKPGVSQCKRRFHSRPHPTTPCVKDVTLDENGCAHESWHCSGVREISLNAH
jgi:hypothetical protein